MIVIDNSASITSQFFVIIIKSSNNHQFIVSFLHFILFFSTHVYKWKLLRVKREILPKHTQRLLNKVHHQLMDSTAGRKLQIRIFLYLSDVRSDSLGKISFFLLYYYPFPPDLLSNRETCDILLSFSKQSLSYHSSQYYCALLIVV